VKRREFITLLGRATVAWPLAARAQQPDMVRRIGVLSGLTENDPESVARRTVFEQALQALGWIAGRNLRIDYRWNTNNDPADIQKLAAELAALAPDVILASGNVVIAPTLRAARTTPIVLVQVIDPVGSGFVESMARPGGNVTGFTQFEYSLAGKWLELLKEIAPGVRRVAVVRDPTRGPGIGQFAVIQAMAPPYAVELMPIDASDPAEAQTKRIEVFATSPNGGLVVTVGGTAFRRDVVIAALQRTACQQSIHIDTSPRRWRPDLLWSRHDRTVPSGSGVRRSYPQRRQAGRLAGSGADKIRTRYQPQNGEGARP
jgi:ABC transporter substrate binding protein